MIAVDSSVVIAGCAVWHEAHDLARRVLDAQPHLVAHCALEAYSVLTRLPPPHRVAAPLVAGFLEDRFSRAPLVLPPNRVRRLPSELVTNGIVGGAVYDALVGLTALAHGATLMTLDRRAESTYRRCGVRYELVAAVD